MSAEDDWITTEEAAEISGFHVEHVRRLLRDGVIVGRRFGPAWMVSRKSLRDYLADADRRKPGPRKKA